MGHNSDKEMERQDKLKSRKETENQPDGRTTRGSDNQEKEQTSYQSTWALAMQRELEQAGKRCKNFQSDWRKENDLPASREEDKITPDSWEQLLKPVNPVKRIRKPIVVKDWFGEESDSTTSSTEDEGEWSEVERRRRNIEKKIYVETILETKKVNNENIVYIAVEEEVLIREIYYRKA